jgi:hypothetical protein
VFTSGNQSWGYTKHRYLIKHQGVWKILKTWASKPDWDDEVTDVIWLQDKETMIASWWQKKNGKRYIKRTPERVKDNELSFLLLKVKETV